MIDSEDMPEDTPETPDVIDVEETPVVAAPAEQKAYTYPTVGNGTTIWAASQKEADEKALKLKADMAAAA